jgi:phosphate transport system permease protein
MHGAFGFVVVDYLLFLVLLAVLTALSAGRAVVVDRVMTVLLASAAVVLIGALGFVVVFTFWHGSAAIWHASFWTQDMSRTGPLDPLTAGGISYALVGTAEQTGLALVFTVPLGIACAIYVREVQGPAARFTRVVVEAMTALPSIVAGLFIYVAAVLWLGLGRSGLAASLSMSVMMLPVIIRAADEVLRLVPNHLREAALATGASQRRVCWHVVLPSARTGLVTAVILGTTRGIGEASPLLLTAGATAGVNTDPVRNPQVSLPLAAFDFVQSPEQTMIARGFATAAALMILVLVLFTVARVLGGTSGRSSAWARRRVRLGSARDSDRIDTRHAVRAEARDAEARHSQAGARRAAAGEEARP